MIRQARNRITFQKLIIIFVSFATMALASCTPRVEVAPPEKPITINLNVKIDHEIRVKVDKDLEDAFSDQSELF